MIHLYKLVIILSLLLFCTCVYAQTTALPYVSGFDNTTEKAGWQLFREADPSLSSWVYSTMSFSSPACITHDYPVGGTSPTDDWYVSPMFNLGGGGKIDSLRYAFSGFGTPHPGDTVAVYLLKGNADPALASSRTLLYDFRDTVYHADGNWRIIKGIKIPAVSGTAYIAFRYYTIINWLDVRFDNIGISGGPASIQQYGISQKTLCYPNPASGVLYLDPDAGIEHVSVRDVSGRELLHSPYMSYLSMANLATGAYIVTFTLKSGNVISENVQLR